MEEKIIRSAILAHGSNKSFHLDIRHKCNSFLRKQTELKNPV